MNNCAQCNQNKPKLPPAVLEVINNDPPVLFHKVVLPASLGDDKTNPPESLNYKNVLLNYAANNHSYLYSSDGVPTFISLGEIDIDEITKQLTQHGVQIEELQTGLTEETESREAAVAELADKLNTEESARVDADNQLRDSISTTNTNLTEAVSEVQSNIAQEVLERSEADEAIKENLNVYVEKETEFNGNGSTLDVVHTKINMSDNATQETTDALPVASTTNAGIMNAATFSAVQENSENIDSILVGAVALTGLPAIPTQAQLTEQWKEATGKTEIVNRASIYDVTNQKIWNYYANSGAWYSAGAGQGSTVTVNQATNDALGIVKGSTQVGQNFVEADGSLSLNGWDATQENIANLTSKLDETAAQLEETQKDANDALADIAAVQADYVSKTKVVSQYSDATDEVNSASFINSTLNGVNVILGDNASPTSDESVVSIGNSSSAAQDGVSLGSGAASDQHSIAIGSGAQANATRATAVGRTAKVINSHQYSVALGANTRTTRPYEVSIGDSSSPTQPYTTRYLANVRMGQLDTDAVNVAQLSATADMLLPNEDKSVKSNNIDWDTLRETDANNWESIVPGNLWGTTITVPATSFNGLQAKTIVSGISLPAGRTTSNTAIIATMNTPSDSNYSGNVALTTVFGTNSFNILGGNIRSETSSIPQSYINLLAFPK